MIEKAETINQYGKFWIDEHGIFNFKYHPGVIVDLEAAQDICKEKNKIYNGKRYCIIVDFSGLKHLSPEASKYFSTQEGSPLVTAAAFLVNTFFSKQNAISYLKVYNYPCPIMIFTEREEAIRWLSKYQ